LGTAAGHVRDASGNGAFDGAQTRAFQGHGWH
jgi:hypothetical protein